MRKLLSSVLVLGALALGLTWTVPTPASAMVVDSPSFDACVATAKDLCKYGVASFSYSDGKCSFTCNPAPKPVQQSTPETRPSGN